MDEMSGEFGDNVSISSRRKSVVIVEDNNVIISYINIYIYICTYIAFFKLNIKRFFYVLKLILHQVASRPDKVNCNVHKTLASTMDQDNS